MHVRARRAEPGQRLRHQRQHGIGGDLLFQQGHCGLQLRVLPGEAGVRQVLHLVIRPDPAPFEDPELARLAPAAAPMVWARSRMSW